MPFLRYMVSIGFPQTVSTYSENVALLTLRKLLRACFANAALIYLVSSSTLLPMLVRMHAENSQFFEDAPRTPTLLENLLLLQCAFHWSENRLELARETWKAGNDYLSGLPQTGSNNYDRDCQASLLELIEKHAALHAQKSTELSRQRPTAFATLAATE